MANVGAIAFTSRLYRTNSDGYSVLKLNALSWEVMRKQRTVSLAVPIAQKITWEEGNEKQLEAEILYRNCDRSVNNSLMSKSVPPYVDLPTIPL